MKKPLTGKQQRWGSRRLPTHISLKCVVCGANVAESRRRRDEIMVMGLNTCDPICTRAKHGRRTRLEQIWKDDEEEIQQERNNALNKPIQSP